MENEEKIIKIINEIDNLVGDAVDEGLLLSSDMYDDLFINNYDVLDEFSDDEKEFYDFDFLIKE